MNRKNERNKEMMIVMRWIVREENAGENGVEKRGRRGGRQSETHERRITQHKTKTRVKYNSIRLKSTLRFAAKIQFIQIQSELMMNKKSIRE